MSSELKTIDRKLRDIQEMLEVSDLMNEEDTWKYLNVSLKTLQNKVYDGTLAGCYVINKIGHRMYYRSKISGLRK